MYWHSRMSRVDQNAPMPAPGGFQLRGVPQVHAQAHFRSTQFTLKLAELINVSGCEVH
jgi:hypothetical protein